MSCCSLMPRGTSHHGTHERRRIQNPKQCTMPLLTLKSIIMKISANDLRQAMHSANGGIFWTSAVFPLRAHTK